MSNSQDLLAAVRQLRAEGYYQSAIASTFGISRGSVSDYLTGRYAPGEKIAARAFENYRFNEALEGEGNKTFANGVTHQVMWMPRSLSPASDLDYWKSQHPNAKAFFVRFSDGSGGMAQTYVGKSTKALLSDFQHKQAKYARKPKLIGGEEDTGVEFVAVYY